jgi:hypothetical protein
MRRNLFLVLLACTVLFVACSDYGKKVKINEYTEVYYKGEGVTETDAKKLGDYITTTYKDSKNNKSFQLVKDSGQYVVRMVVDPEKVKDNSLDVSFMALQFLFESQVFSGNKVKLILTDNLFKDIKTFRGTGDSKADTLAK